MHKARWVPIVAMSVSTILAEACSGTDESAGGSPDASSGSGGGGSGGGASGGRAGSGGGSNVTGGRPTGTGGTGVAGSGGSHLDASVGAGGANVPDAAPGTHDASVDAASEASTTDASTGGATSTGGVTGTGGSGGAWPTCDAVPSGVPMKTLHEVWQDDPPTPTEVWIAGVYVTSISDGTCQSGIACAISLQSAQSYVDLQAASQQALQLLVAPNAASHFSGVHVGDIVDLDAFASRYTLSGQNELLLQVSATQPGCAKATGTGVATPVPVTLDALTRSAYESSLGPLLVTVSLVSGRPQTPTESFGLWPTGGFLPSDPSKVVSLSPACLSGSAFSGFTPAAITDFTSVSAAFRLLSLGAPPALYLILCPRTMSDVSIGTVH